MDIYQMFFKEWKNFKGKTGRTEYLVVTLTHLFVVFLLSVLIRISYIQEACSNILGLYAVIVCIPTVSLTVRRLHDLDKSGWWYLLSFIPGIGPLLLLGMCFREKE